YMGSAEHRTTGDEAEFFFDPMGPNDRFTSAPNVEPSSAPRSDDPDREEVPAEATPDFDAVPLEDPPDAEPATPGLDNNFAADDDYAPPPPRPERGGRGDRGRGDRGRGDRGRGDRGRPGGGFGGYGRGRDGGMKPPPIETIFKRGQEV